MGCRAGIDMGIIESFIDLGALGVVLSCSYVCEIRGCIQGKCEPDNARENYLIITNEISVVV